jgi:hypothetical protein
MSYRDWLYNQLGGSSSMQTVTSAETAPQLAVTGGKRYVFTQPLNSLTITSVEDSEYESEIEFTCNGEVSLPPTGLKYIGIAPEDVAFETGITYIINICNSRAVIGEVSE